MTNISDNPIQVQHCDALAGGRVVNYHEAVEHAKTLAPQYGLGVRQQDALASMLDRGRWPVALPGTGGGAWLCGSSWSASLKMMTSLAGKGVLVPTGKTYTNAGVEYPEYVLADTVLETLPATTEPEPLAAPAEAATEPADRKTTMPTDIESAVAEDLRSAAASYAIALDAMRVDVAANVAALHKGKVRQLSNNAAELLVRFGELTAMHAHARNVLPDEKIRAILEDATRHIENAVRP